MEKSKKEKRNELELGNEMMIKQIDINDLREQDMNPRILPNSAMRQLIKNVGNRGILESLPYCVQTERNIEIISGHHRVRAARAAGFNDIYILMDTSGLTRDEIKAKQLAHNSINGFDDPELLAELYNGINSAEARLEAYINEDALAAQLEKIQPINIGDIGTDLTFRQISFLFLPHQLEKFEDVFDTIERDTELVCVSKLDYYDKFKVALLKIRECEDIRSVGMILSKMCDITKEYYEKKEEG